MAPVANPPEPPPVVLASVVPAPETPKPAAARAATPRPKPPAAKPKKDPNAIWVAQVGSFRARSDANTWLKEVRRRFTSQFNRAEGEVVNAAGRFRVRYVGMTEAAAKKACAALKAKRLDCMVLKGR